MADCNNSNVESQPRKGVIYKITNLENGKVYVGQTVQKLSLRISQHRHSDRKGVDQAIKKHGLEKFKVEVLEECPREMLNEREKYWIKFFNCMVPNGYNLTDGGDTNFIVSDETRAKISEAHKNPSPETRAKLSESHKGQTPWNKGKKLEPLSEEHKAKISASTKNPPPEIRAKMSEAHSGKKNPFYGKHHTEESKAKMSASKVGTQCGEDNPFYGKHHTEETKSLISVVHKGKVVSAETRAKMSEAHKNPSPETRAKLSAASSGENNPFYGKHHTPETKAKISATKKAKKLAEKKNADIAISLFENDNN